MQSLLQPQSQGCFLILSHPGIGTSLIKYQCDGVLPRCGKCNDSQHDCDITSRVFYSYQDVKDLVDKIQELEARLETSQSRPAGHGVDFDDAHRFDVNVQLQQSGLAWEIDQRNARQVDQISQELGALSLGHADMMAQYYGKR